MNVSVGTVRKSRKRASDFPSSSPNEGAVRYQLSTGASACKCLHSQEIKLPDRR
jgi:hypothetical protein